jgi:LacI family transcriptional regulator
MTAKRRIAVQMQINQPFNRHIGVFAGIHEYARGPGDWHLVVDEWAGHTLPARDNNLSPYDGLVGRISPRGARRARRLDMPVVNVQFSSQTRGLPGVYPDHAECGRLRAEHLLARGFQNFGVLHEDSRGSVVESEAFEQLLREANCAEFSKVVLGSVNEDGTRIEISYREWQRAILKIDRWMETWRPPIGLYIQDIHMARVVIEKCTDRGWRVPEDVAIVSGYNETELCEMPEPAITSLEVPYEKIGFEAARLLDKLIDEKQDGAKKRRAKKTENEAPKTILLPPVGIVARRSTDFFAVDDEVIRRALRFLDANFHEPLAVDAIAKEVNVSRRTLEIRFREKLGRTVANEILRLRIERAKRELIGSDLPIYQIARRAGFGSPRTLNDQFRTQLGCSPREYRQRNQGHPAGNRIVR